VDVEMAEAFAPRRSLLSIPRPIPTCQYGLFSPCNGPVDDNTVSILNISFGACEQDLGAGGNRLHQRDLRAGRRPGHIDHRFLQALRIGGLRFQLVKLQRSGFLGSGPWNGFASTPWNVALVAQTSMCCTRPVFRASNSTSRLRPLPLHSWHPPLLRTALSYIPERAVEDSTEFFTTYANNAPYKYGNGPENKLAGGGA